MRDENARPITLFIQIDQQIEVKIDNPTGVKSVDSFFDRFLGRDHVLAEENRGLPAFAQGYAGQAADVTDRIDSAFVMSSEVETSLNQYQ